MSGLISVMTLHYAANSGTSPWIDWLSWLESEPLEPILVLIKLSSQLWNEMWHTVKEGCGGNNKLSMSYSSTQAHKEDVFMGGGVGGWQRLIIPLYPGCWDYIFSLSFLWGYSSEEGDSQLIFPAVISLVKELCLLTAVLFLLLPLSSHYYQSWALFPLLVLVLMGVYKPWTYLLSQIHSEEQWFKSCWYHLI